MKREVLKKYLDRFEDDYNLPNVMLSVFWMYYKHTVSFVEISFQRRKAGKNSINIKKIISIGLKALKEFGLYAKNMKNMES